MPTPETEQLLEDLKRVVHDAEDLLHATAGQAGEHIAQVRTKAEASLRSAREQLAAMSGDAAARARRAADRADSFVQGNPWIAVGAGAAVGLLLGLLVGHRRGNGSP
jgi:ElaB/YqjD/DUF883 family membrane-anchored ribosome-binding protein